MVEREYAFSAQFETPSGVHFGYLSFKNDGVRVEQALSRASTYKVDVMKLPRFVCRAIDRVVETFEVQGEVLLIPVDIENY